MRGLAGGATAIVVTAAILIAAAACTSSHGAPVRPTTAAQATGSGTSTATVTVEPRATAASPPMSSIVRPHAPGPLPGDLVDATPEPDRCTDPYVTPTGSPAPAEAPSGDATPTAVRIFHPPEVPTPAAVEEPPLRPDGELERRIRARLGDQASHYAVVIKDLGDGRGVSIDGDRVFYAASLFKLEVMYEIFHQRDAGLLDLSERYVASDYYAGFGLGPRLVAQCQAVSIADALLAMMSVSDNTAAVMLQDRAGAGHINDAMAALGLQHTQLTEDQSLPTTAADMARLVETIARGEAVSRDASQAMADLMATEKINDRIPRRLPDGTVVAHKTGNWEHETHDAGIVYGTKSTYVMVLMSDIGFDGDAGSVEADVARIAWDYFEGG